ncbi:MAG: hypothetical protein II014_00690 [Bifidobacteriaceae bacterium]|nr:hypothetical protein [Bifidobacteriaceae bacterium]
MDENNANPWLKNVKENNAYDQNLVKTNIDDDQEEDFMKSSAGMYAREAAARRAYKRMADVKDDEGKRNDDEFLHISEVGGYVYVRDDKEKTENKFDSWADALEYISELHGDKKDLEDDLEDDKADKGVEEVDARRASYQKVDYTRRASLKRNK